MMNKFKNYNLFPPLFAKQQTIRQNPYIRLYIVFIPNVSKIIYVKINKIYLRISPDLKSP